MRVGIYPFVGVNENYKLSEDIISHIYFLDLETLNMIKIPPWEILKGDYWFLSKYLGFIAISEEIFDNYIYNLYVVVIRLIYEEDKPILSWNKGKG